jgi:cytochrome c peroxidase
MKRLFAFAFAVSALFVACEVSSGAAGDLVQSSEHAVSYRLGLPDLAAVHSDTPLLRMIGQKLFFDRRFSRDRSLSCSSCHMPDKYFSDGLRVSKGVKNGLGTRNAPSLLNIAFNTSQFWDGRVTTLEEQVLGPMTNPREMGMPDASSVMRVVRGDKYYRSALSKIFQLRNTQELSAEHVASAIAAYERTLISGNSAFDRYAFAGESDALTESARRGLRLFSGPAGCASCHTIGDKDALLTDNEFHNLSVGLGRIGDHLADLITEFSSRRSRGEALDTVVLSNDEFAELGRFTVTQDPGDIAKFRTPSLRNVAVTGPYMHDGSVATLEEAVDMEVYYRSTQRGRPLLLTPTERRDLVEFLKALTGVNPFASGNAKSTKANSAEMPALSRAADPSDSAPLSGNFGMRDPRVKAASGDSGTGASSSAPKPTDAIAALQD